MVLENDESSLIDEDLTKFRWHKSVERPNNVSKDVKNAQGYTCKGCDTNFLEKYGEIGKSCIEAHHLTPVHLVKGQKLKRNPLKDYAVLCANCHRIIHKLDDTSNIDALRKFLRNM